MSFETNTFGFGSAAGGGGGGATTSPWSVVLANGILSGGSNPTISEGDTFDFISGGFTSVLTRTVQTAIRDWTFPDASGTILLSNLLAAPLGIATLDAAGIILSSQLPFNLMQFLGNWDAATNTPILANTDVGEQGNTYRVSVAGTVDFGAGNITFAVGDWCYNNGTIWDKGVNTDSVTTVNGSVGAVTTPLTDVLVEGNEMANGQVIIAQNGGGQLNLRDIVDGAWSLTSDNGAYGAGSAWVYGEPNKGAQLAHQITAGEAIGIGVYANATAITANTAKEIVISNNSIDPSSSGNIVKRAVFVGAQNASMVAGVINAVVASGLGIVAGVANSLYANVLRLQAAANNFDGIFDIGVLTAPRTYTFQNASGTVAFIGDVNTAAAKGSVSISTSSFQSSGNANYGYILNTNMVNYFFNGVGGGLGQSAKAQTVFTVPKNYVSGGTMIIELQKSQFINNILMTAFIEGVADSTIINASVQPIAIGVYEKITLTFGDALTPGQAIGIDLNFQGANNQDILIRSLYFNFG